MPRPPVNIDREELIAAIQMVEESGPLSTLATLYDSIAKVMDNDASVSIIKARIEEWQIPIKTQARRRAAKKAAPEPQPSLVPQGRLRPVSAPSGKCPYKLTSIDFDVVSDWASKVRSAGIGDSEYNGVYYTLEALIYFSRQFFELGTPENKVVKDHLCFLDNESSDDDLQNYLDHSNDFLITSSIAPA